MIDNIKIFILISFTLISCNRRPGEIPSDPNVQAIITVCITATIGNIDSAKYYHKLIPFLNEKQYLNFRRKYNDSMKSLLDTAAVYLVVKDTLGQIGAGDREDLGGFIKTYLIDIDSTMLIWWTYPLKPSSQKVDLSELERSLLIRIRSKEEGINDDIRLIGKCIFSNVIFNKMKTKAAVLLSYFFINRRSGYGEMFLLNKEKDKWKVVRRERTWIS